MARVIAALLFFLITNGALQAQPDWGYLDHSPERIIGLLDLPEVVANGCDLRRKRSTVRVLEAPLSTGREIGRIYLNDHGNAGCWLMIERAGGIKEELPDLPTGLDIAAAVVYERRGGWFRIALQSGSGWIQRKDAKSFLPYPDLLRARLAHTRENWDGRLFTAPGTSGTAISLNGEVHVEYLGSRRVGDELWIHLRWGTNRCESPTDAGAAVKGPSPVSGWTRAYRPNGAPSVWFYNDC